MQLKNNESRNHQFFYHKKVEGSKTSTVDFIHIPGGATVEIEDDVFAALCKSQTVVSVIEERMVPLDKDNVGAQMKTDGEILMIKEYYDTGRKKKVSLIKELIKDGKLTVVSRPGVSLDEAKAFLNGKKISVKEMSDDEVMALYDELA